MADKRVKGGKGAKGGKADKGAKVSKSAGPAKMPKKEKQEKAPKAAGPVTQERPRAYKKMSSVETHYRESVKPELMKKFQYTSVMQVPRFQKIVVNMGVGDALQDAKLLDAAMNELGQIVGQKPIKRRARKSISNFKLREGVPVGCCVTLRGRRMYEFYDRLVNVAVPRIRDFRGMNPRSFDGRGNYTLGLQEQIIFPEIDYDKVGRVRGMDVTIVTSARTDEEGRELMRLMKMPFRPR